MKNVLITSAGKRVVLVNIFQKTIQELHFDAKVFTVDLRPEMAPACVMSDGSFPVPRCTEESYIDSLMDICKNHNVGVIIPTIDTELMALAKSRQRFLQSGVNVVVSDEAFIIKCRDKRHTAVFFKELGIDIPKPINKKHKNTFRLFSYHNEHNEHNHKKNENNNEPMEEMRVKTVMLLSDGYDNDYGTEEIVDEVKKITKGQNLAFTLHTFGYGEDYDSKLMSKLAIIRDGSFFAVENIDKIQEYFVNALGGCMSIIYNQIKLKIRMLKKDYKIKKIFGQDKLFQFELKDDTFSFENLQIISGKEYTYTFEVELPEIIAINENIFEVVLIGDNDEKYTEFGKYKIVGGGFSIADEEYLKNKLYDTLDEAIKLKEQNKIEQMNIILNKMKDWIEKNYEGINKRQYIKKLNEAMGYLENNHSFQSIGRARITADIYENQLRRGGIYSNKVQSHMISSLPKK